MSDRFGMLEFGLVGSAHGLAPGPDPGDKTRTSAAAIFEGMQDRHVPVTPALAQRLAQLGTARRPASVPVWGRGYDLAGAAIGLDRRLGNSEGWKRLADVYRITIAEPVLRVSAVHLGMVCLVGPGTDAAQDAVDYDAYAALLERSVAGLLADPKEMGQGFWIAAGVTLLSHYRVGQRTVTRRADDGAAGVSPVAVQARLAQLVYEIEPEFPKNAVRVHRRMKPMRRSHRDRVGYRPKEGGVTGARRSRRLEDLPDALPSAFVHPRDLQLVMWAEEGFNVVLRPPKRRRTRDLLALGYCVADPGSDAAAVFKAAWIDAMPRLRIVLEAMRLTQTELGWADRRTLGLATAGFSLSSEINGIVGVGASPFGPRAALDPMALAGDQRRESLTRLALVPRIFEEVPDTLIDSATGSAEDTVAARQVAAAVIAASLASRQPAATTGARAAAATDTQQIVLSDYGVVFVLQVCPAEPRVGEFRVPDWSADRRAIIAGMGLDQARHVHAAMVLVPGRLDPGQGFTVVSDRDRQPQTLLLEDDGDVKAALARLIGLLSLWVQDEVIEAVHG